MGEILAPHVFTAKLSFSFHGQVLHQEELRDTLEVSNRGGMLCTASPYCTGGTAAQLDSLVGNLELLS